jgi:hypothetical protein
VLRAIGLGLLVGAVLHANAGAQVRDTARTKRDTLRAPTDTVTGRDTSTVKRDTSRDVIVRVPPRNDTLLRHDSTAKPPAPPRDTIKAPLTHAEAPVLADQTGSFVWDRRDIFATGALTAQDLLERIPGVTGLQSLWISQPIIASYLGDPARVRVFLDGLELQEMDPRMSGFTDLSQIPLWALDDVRVERGASEIRIYMRTWRVDRTTPYSRTDVYTGDQGTNLYRGLFGRRYDHGEVLQLAGQQYNTAAGRLNNSSDALGVLTRLGIARERWSVDAFMIRTNRHRGLMATSLTSDSIPETSSTGTTAYLRGGWGNTDRGPWVQALASTTHYVISDEGTSSGTPDSLRTDTSRSAAQYVVSGGYVRGPWHASATQRYTVADSRRIAAPSARFGFDSRMLQVSVFAEGRGLDSARHLEASAIAKPLSFVFVGGSVGTERPRLATDSNPVANFARGEAGLRVKDVWLSGGVLHRDATLLAAPTIFLAGTVPVLSPATNGIFATVRGRLWKAMYADVQGVQWSDTAGVYRPRYQTRSELYLSTSMIDRFPTNNFHLLASIVHEYRSASYWPDSTGLLRVSGDRTISTYLEFRIVRADVFWSFRNILRERYEQIPGYQMPRGTSVYGVRWEFWN